MRYDFEWPLNDFCSVLQMIIPFKRERERERERKREREID